MKKNLRNLLGASFLLTAINSFGQYCSPSTGLNGCNYGDYIANVTLGAINNPTGCNGPLGDFTAMNTILYTDSSYHAFVSLNPDFNQGIGIFIDWNQNQDFGDPGEFYSNGNVTSAGGTENILVSVPSSALPGSTRMRVGCQYATSMGQGNACATSGNYGEFEDYTLIVKQKLPYSDSVTANGASAVANFGDFSTCQETVVLNATSTTDNGSAWVDGNYMVYVNGSTIGSFTGTQTIDLTSYIPVTSVSLSSTESGMTSISGTVSVISSGASNPNPGPIVSDVSYCVGDASNLLTATMQGNGQQLKWYTSIDGYGYTTVGPIPSTATADTMYYWVSQADATWCESLRSKITVIVHALPNAPVVTDQSFCQGAMVSDLIPAASANVNWYDDAQSTTPLSTSTELIGASYFVDTVNAYGCYSPKSEVVVSMLNSTGSETATACDFYTWSTNGMTYTASGAYLDTLTNVAGCDSVVTLNLTINALPAISVMDNGDGTFTASGATTYQWYDCNTQNPISGAVSATFAPTADGSYFVQGTSAQGCSDTSACVDLTDLGLGEKFANQVSVYPNPSSGIVTVATPAAGLFTLTDIQGAVILKGTIAPGGQIDCTKFANGVYMLHLNVKGTEVIKRIVKQ